MVQTAGEPAQGSRNSWGFEYLETAKECREREVEEQKQVEEMYKEDEEYYKSQGISFEDFCGDFMNPQRRLRMLAPKDE